MNTGAKSLRLLIEKWLAPVCERQIRVTRFSRRPGGTRCVRVEAQRRDGGMALFFFRHKDGVWRVFPPEAGRATLGGGHTVT
jgi:hypothetical protein